MVAGVYSRSAAKPLKVGNFDTRFVNFDNKERISDWKFTAAGQGIIARGAPVSPAPVPAVPGSPAQPPPAGAASPQTPPPAEPVPAPAAAESPPMPETPVTPEPGEPVEAPEPTEEKAAEPEDDTTTPKPVAK